MPSHVHGLAGAGELAVAAGFGGEVDDHGTRLHAVDHVCGDQTWCAGRGSAAVVMTRSISADVPGDRVRVRGPRPRTVPWHSPPEVFRAAAMTFRGDEGGAEGQDLFARGGRTSKAVTTAPRRRAVAMA